MASLAFAVTATNIADTSATLSTIIYNASVLNQSSVNVVCTGGAGFTTACTDWKSIAAVQWPVTGLVAGTTYTCTGYNYAVGDTACADTSKALYAPVYQFTTLNGPPAPAASDSVMTADTVAAILIGIILLMALLRLNY